MDMKQSRNTGTGIRAGIQKQEAGQEYKDKKQSRNTGTESRAGIQGLIYYTYI